MEKTTITISLIDKAISGLRKAAVELEEFQLQLVLGKAEASDKYEELKKKFADAIQSAMKKLSNTKIIGNDLKGKFDELLLQLSLGKAETREVFNEQKIRILNAVQEIENILRTIEIGAELYLNLYNEIQKFKIKIEILRLKFELKKLDGKNEFEVKKADFEMKIDEIKHKFIEKGSSIKKNWVFFCNEMSEAYVHLKKAFNKL